MRKQLLCSGCSLVGVAFLTGLAACSSNASHPDAGNPPRTRATRMPDAGQGCEAGPVEPQLRAHRRHGDDDPWAHPARHGHRCAADAGLLVQQRRKLRRRRRRSRRHVEPAANVVRLQRAPVADDHVELQSERKTRPVSPVRSTASTTRAASASSSRSCPTSMRGLDPADAGEAPQSTPSRSISAATRPSRSGG